MVHTPRRTLALLALGSLAFLTGCGGGENAGSETGAQGTASASCADVLALRQDSLETREGGLQVGILEEGEGPAAESGDSLRMHYVGCLTDTTKFDASRDRGEPFGFVLGQGQVIQGWDRGLQGIRPGGERLLVIPPELGYGSRGAGQAIPPDATLVFKVERLGAAPDTAGGGV